MTQSVLQRVAAGEPEAMRECLDQYGGLVWSLARRICPADAEDGAQEVFVELWKNAKRFDPMIAAENTFVAMIARRRLIDRSRARARSPQTAPVQDAIPVPPAGVPLSDDAKRAAAAIAQLSPDQQKALLLSILRGLSHEQIAQATGLPLGTVKTHIRRGLIRVREIIESRSLQGGAA